MFKLLNYWIFKFSSNILILIVVCTIKRSNPNKEAEHSSAQKWVESLMSLENNSGKKLCYVSGPAHMNDASKEVTD